MKALLTLLLIMFPFLVAAEGWPALFDVTGVANDDRLNIRVAPSANEQVLNSLDPDATDIEIIKPDASGSWGSMNVDERTGWVSLAFLTRQPGT